MYGDWGIQKEAAGLGSYWNVVVAKAMSTFSYSNPVNQILALGNNFYPNGVESIYDPLWTKYLTGVYNSYSDKVRWQAVFGNIDYGSDGSDGSKPKQGNVASQCIFELDERWKAMHCTYLPFYVPETSVLIDVVFIDTPLLGIYI